MIIYCEQVSSQLLIPGEFTIDTIIAPAISRDNLSWDGNMFESGDLFFHDDTFYWYYHANGPDTKFEYEIGVASATNPKGRWTRKSAPVLPSTETWENVFAACPFVLEYEKKFYMYYTGVEAETEISRVGLAISDNPSGPWEKQGIVLTTKNASYVGSVCFVDSVWYLYYSYPNELQDDYGNMYVATSDSPNGPWKEYPGPVLTYGEKGAFDEAGFSESEVSYYDGMFHMFFGGGRYDDKRLCVKESIGYAYSEDGFNFTKYSENPVIRRESIPDAGALAEVHHLIRYPNIYVVFTYRRDNCGFEEDLGIAILNINENK